VVSGGKKREFSEMRGQGFVPKSPKKGFSKSLSALGGGGGGGGRKKKHKKAKNGIKGKNVLQRHRGYGVHGKGQILLG